jgi:putative intracellular protease/amidase
LSNPAVSSTTGWPVGFWWSEVTHPYFKFTETGYEVELFSPRGDPCEADAMSGSRGRQRLASRRRHQPGLHARPQFVRLLEATRPVDEIDLERFDATVVAGGHGPMFTFDTATNLHAKFVELYEGGKVCAALCHSPRGCRGATATHLDRAGTLRAAPRRQPGIAVNSDGLSARIGPARANEECEPWRHHHSAPTVKPRRAAANRQRSRH